MKIFDLIRIFASDIGVLPGVAFGSGSALLVTGSNTDPMTGFMILGGILIVLSAVEIRLSRQHSADGETRSELVRAIKQSFSDEVLKVREEVKATRDEIREAKMIFDGAAAAHEMYRAEVAGLRADLARVKADEAAKETIHASAKRL